MMNRQEIIEFLELNASATDAEISRRALDKKPFFIQLHSNAPNELLKNLHSRNIKKIDEILEQFKHFETSNSSSSILSSASINNSLNSKSNSQPIAWLIRHTEQMSSKTYPLNIGRNNIGRENTRENHVILDNDPYISRHHAFIEMLSSPQPCLFISDGVYKPSVNGVYINANPNRIIQKTEIFNDDTIQIGNTKLVLKILQLGNSIAELQKEVDESEYKETVIINLM